MPNIIDSTFETSTNGQTFRFGADVDFLQYGIRDGDASILESLITGYDSSKNYSLKGLVASSSAGTTTITEGYVYGVNKALGGMIARRYIYAAVGQSFPDPSGSDVIVGTITPYSQAYADPTEFYDITTLTTTTQNVHNEYRIVWSTGPSGSGDFDYDDIVPCKENWAILTPTGTQWTGSGLFYKRDLLTNTGYLYGVVSTSGTTPAATIAVLPSGYRPAKTIIGTGMKSFSGTNTGFLAGVADTGDVLFAIPSEVPSVTGTTAYFSLSFPLT